MNTSLKWALIDFFSRRRKTACLLPFCFLCLIFFFRSTFGTFFSFCPSSIVGLFLFFLYRCHSLTINGFFPLSLTFTSSSTRKRTIKRKNYRSCPRHYMVRKLHLLASSQNPDLQQLVSGKTSRYLSGLSSS